MFGPVRDITKYEFEQSIVYDTKMDSVLEKKAFYGGGITTTTFSSHYFKDGVEIGYWLDMMDSGFIFEQPRTWHPLVYAQLRESKSV